ncbi:N-6 DNA methylase [Streptomyces sp. NPDC000963]
MRIKDCDRAHLVVSEARAERARTASAPGELVRQAKRLVEKAEELLEQAVIAERERGTSWEKIGQAIGGQSKSAAHKRYAPALTEHLECVDVTTVEDEDSGQEVPIFHRFLLAYGLLENTWNEVKQIVESQDVLDHLREATVAASGDGWVVAERAGARAVEDPDFRAAATVAGDAYEKMIQDVGDKLISGTYYTPRALIDRLVKTSLMERATLQSWADPALGSGSMLRSAIEHIERLHVEDSDSASLAARLEAVESRLAAVEAVLADAPAK